MNNDKSPFNYLQVRLLLEVDLRFIAASCWECHRHRLLQGRNRVRWESQRHSYRWYAWNGLLKSTRIFRNVGMRPLHWLLARLYLSHFLWVNCRNRSLRTWLNRFGRSLGESDCRGLILQKRKDGKLSSTKISVPLPPAHIDHFGS